VNALSYDAESHKEESMTAESSHTPFLWCWDAFAWHRGRWGGRRYDRGPIFYPPGGQIPVC